MLHGCCSWPGTEMSGRILPGGNIITPQIVPHITRVLVPVLVLLVLMMQVQSLATAEDRGTSPYGYLGISVPGSTVMTASMPVTGGPDTAATVIKAAQEKTLTLPPVRQNRTALLQAVVKSVIPRPMIAIPVFWLLVLFGSSFAGLCALLYVLIRGRYAAASRKKRPDGDASRNKTVIGPLSDAPAGSAKKERQGPAVQFPPSLEKRFIHAEFIGEGGLGRVFRAQNAKTKKTVAVKVPIRFDDVTGTHFSRDIFLWQGLHHKNILEIFSYNILPVPYVEMEYAPSSLADMHFPVPEDQALALTRSIAAGLAYAHGKGIIHRDIKPDNILITADGSPKITDWGMARAIDDMRKSSMIGFSPVYAAPEQIAPKMYGTPGPGTDIYQIGVLLYEMLTGNVPFEDGDLHNLTQALLYDKVPQPSWEGTHKKEIFAIIEKCLRKRPEERYDSVASLIEALESVHIRG